MEPENTINKKDKPAVLAKIDSKAVEYTFALSSILFEKLKKAVSMP